MSGSGCGGRAPRHRHPLQPQVLVRLRRSGDALSIGAGDGVLRLEIVQPAGGKPMRVDDYLRGHELPKLA